MYISVISFKMCPSFFKKFPFDMFTYFHIKIGPAVIDTIQRQDLDPLVCGSAQIVPNLCRHHSHVGYKSKQNSRFC